MPLPHAPYPTLGSLQSTQGYTYFCYKQRNPIQRMWSTWETPRYLSLEHATKMLTISKTRKWTMFRNPSSHTFVPILGTEHLRSQEMINSSGEQKALTGHQSSLCTRKLVGSKTWGQAQEFSLFFSIKSFVQFNCPRPSGSVSGPWF